MQLAAICLLGVRTLRRYAQAHPRSWLPGVIGPPSPGQHVVAAKILGLSRQRTRQLAEAEQAPALRDDKGRCWTPHRLLPSFGGLTLSARGLLI